MKMDERLAGLGKRLSDERNKSNLKQGYVMAKLGLSEESTSTIRNWEKGRSIPTLDNLCRLADLYKCDVAYLLGESPTRRWQEKEVAEYTGLRVEAVRALHKEAGAKNREGYALFALSALIYYLDKDSVERWITQCISTGYYSDGSERPAKVLSDGSVTLCSSDAFVFIKNMILAEFAGKLGMILKMIVKGLSGSKGGNQDVQESTSRERKYPKKDGHKEG